MQNPRQYKIPDWFLNRQKDVVDGKFSQVCKSKLIAASLLNKLKPILIKLQFLAYFKYS